MLVLSDIISGDEILSDAYKYTKTEDGMLYQAPGNYIQVMNEETEMEDTVVDIIHGFSLEKADFKKKAYVMHLKHYMKDIVARLTEKGAAKEEIDAFMKGAEGVFAKIVKNFKKYDFYTGESADPSGMVIFVEWGTDAEGNETCVFNYWAHEDSVSLSDDCSCQLSLTHEPSEGKSSSMFSSTVNYSLPSPIIFHCKRSEDICSTLEQKITKHIEQISHKCRLQMESKYVYLCKRLVNPSDIKIVKAEPHQIPHSTTKADVSIKSGSTRVQQLASQLAALFNK
ncbi:Translationally controlled tumour protein like protein [Aduncisulcus paluster]|uniref:Translationally controlled tumour protein like protein n=1 Tax=Aduncisulcus paluster TaxID=2918883 RepID=A0ABQ5JTP8_9EUKA|nr:Translationally controlled tumour protein like protein [Aduncisulcus paluster]